MDCTQTEPESKLGLALSAAERKLLFDLPILNDGVVAVIQQTTQRTVQLSVAQLDDLADALSARANHVEDKKLQGRLDNLVRSIDRLTANHLLTLLESTGQVVQPVGSGKPNRNGPKLAVTLTTKQRETLESVCARKNLQQRLQGDVRQSIEFTHREVEYLHDQARMGLVSASSLRKKRLLSACNKIGKILGKPQLVEAPSPQSVKNCCNDRKNLISNKRRSPRPLS